MQETEYDVRVVVTHDGNVYMGVLSSETDDKVVLTHCHKIILRSGPNNQSLFYEPFPLIFTEFLTNPDEEFSFNKVHLLNSNLAFDLEKAVTSENYTFKQVYLTRAGLVKLESPAQETPGNLEIPKLF
jgi:hypothetical protein